MKRLNDVLEDLISRNYIPESYANAPVDVPVNGANAPVDVPVSVANAPVNAPVDALVGNAKKTDKEKNPLTIEEQIMVFCSHPKSILEIAKHLGYKDKRSIRKHLHPLLEQGRVAMTLPEKPNSRLQKYITIK